MSTGLLLLFALCGCAVAAQLTTPGGCMHNGHMYTTGQSFSPTPCEHCYCTSSGNVACAIADCFFTMCADAVHDPTKCCPVCPNGPNCRAPDGTLIKQGETYKPDADTTCMCPQNSFGFHGNMAMCAIKAPEPVTAVMVS